MFTSLIHVQYCYAYLVDQIPFGLLLYSHVPTALIAILFATYVLFRTRTLASINLFIVCVAFAAFCVLDLGSWFSFLGAGSTMFVWSILDFLTLIMFFFSYYFFYTFITGNDLPLWQKIVGFLLLMPTSIWTFLGLNLPSYDANTCEAIENTDVTHYLFVIEALFILAVIVMAIVLYRRYSEKRMKREVVLAGSGIAIFLTFFFSSTLLVSLLAASDASQYVYNFEIYGLFGMPILLIYLGYLIVRYKAFDVKAFGAQALVIALVVVIGSEFAFINTLVNRVLVSVTLVLTGVIGVVLIRSVRKEIEQREHIELLARDLEKANKQQIILIHFITHQIKGFLTKSRNIFSVLMDGDVCLIPDQAKPMIEEGFRSDTKGVETVQEILNAANIKNGKVSYTMETFDLKALIEDIVKDLKPNADKKQLALELELPDTLSLTGDRGQLLNAIKNLVDNSIKYTPSGSVKVILSKEDNTARITVQDTGVGITPEDMTHLFTEGGHGKDSQKINVESTGFGLYIVKNIIEAHKGKVWAESQGEGKGSRFIIELPIG